MKPLVIIGAGGHGRELLDIVQAMNDEDPVYEFLGFLDDTGGVEAVLARRGTEVLGGISDLESIEAEFLIGIGSGQDRRAIAERAGSWGRHAAIAIHPAATLGSDVSLGEGCVIAAGARLTTNVRLGRHVHLNTNSTVAHDCRLGDYVTVAPGANVAGRAIIGEGVFIGAGAVVRDRVVIGAGSTVGAGAVAVKDVSESVTVIGVPARAVQP